MFSLDTGNVFDNPALSDDEDYNYCNTSSSEDDETDNIIIQQPIEDQLSIWAVSHNVNNVTVNDLLSILKTHQCFKNFPNDSRTLLKTSSSSKKNRSEKCQPRIVLPFWHCTMYKTPFPY